MVTADEATREVTESRIASYGNISIVMNRVEINGLVRGRQIVALDTETVVLRRLAGTWRIIHIHRSQKRIR